LTPTQKQLIVSAAGELIRATIFNESPRIADATLGGSADRIVSGIFVSLKRRKHLRSCCGLLGQPIPLIQALHSAATRTAVEDVRFPPVSPIELAHLDLEVWVLYNPEPVHARGEERIAAVTIGKHGLQVVRGQARGLLLPGVAVDNGWDARRFLDQVCIKAGLHPTAWRDDDTVLFTFEGDVFDGRVMDAETARRLPLAPPLLRPEELNAYVDFCRRNVRAFLYGATPDYYVTGVSDGHVTGASLTIRRPGRDDLTLTQLSLRPGVPLQSTLFALAQTAARGPWRHSRSRRRNWRLSRSAWLSSTTPRYTATPRAPSWAASIRSGAHSS